MKETVKAFLAANKSTIIRKGIVGGVLLAGVAVAVFVLGRSTGSTNEELDEDMYEDDYEESDDESDEESDAGIEA